MQSLIPTSVANALEMGAVTFHRQCCGKCYSVPFKGHVAMMSCVLNLAFNLNDVSSVRSARDRLDVSKFQQVLRTRMS